jgi:xanthine/CO dehydrogenase XdhC/CoxF family maturation factor
LEADLSEHCREVAARGVSRVVAYDTRDENDLVWGVGTGCNGVVRVLVEPVRGVPPALAFVRDAWARREATMLVTEFSDDGGETRVVDNVDVGEESKLVDCDDGSYLFFEYMPPPLALIIFGNGDDAKPLVRMAAELGWIASVRDVRQGVPEGDGRAAVAVMTHRYAHDVELMRGLLPMAEAFAYLGLRGPRKRAEKIFTELERGGMKISEEMRARAHAPVGLDLGGDTPESVALSILAEIQCVIARRDGRPLRERVGTIHNG